MSFWKRCTSQRLMPPLASAASSVSFALGSGAGHVGVPAKGAGEGELTQTWYAALPPLRRAASTAAARAPLVVTPLAFIGLDPLPEQAA